MFFKKKKQEVLTRKESLNSVVVKNEKVDDEVSGSGDITLTVYRDKRSVLARILMTLCGLPEKKKIILDERGSFIWKMCDGKTTLEEMIHRFAGKYTMNRKESEVLIVYFIKSLAQRGLAGIIVKRGSNDRI